jgi:protoheme IX farnesyltransferase
VTPVATSSAAPVFAPESAPSPVAEILRSATAEPESPDLASRIADYRELFKMRVTTMVVITAWAGFYLGSMKSGISSMQTGLIETLVGIGLVSAGSSALNQAIERKSDAKMLRTAGPAATRRPHRPRSRHHPRPARDCRRRDLARPASEPARRHLDLLTAFSYVAIYTPLKRYTPLATFIGAFPGAMPPLIGWVAARGVIEWPAVALFAVLFVWQFPHFMAIAWLYREDYGRAGIKHASRRPARWMVHRRSRRSSTPC